MMSPKGAEEEFGIPFSLPKPATIRFPKPLLDPSSTFRSVKLKGRF